MIYIICEHLSLSTFTMILTNIYGQSSDIRDIIIFRMIEFASKMQRLFGIWRSN